MKLKHQGIPFALSVLAASLFNVAVAAPTSGAYVSDKQNTWVQDRVGDRISTVNMIMCIIGSMRGDAMVNQGPYVALIDQGKCEGRGDGSKSTSTSAGASNAATYMSAVVQSTQASSSEPLVIKAWLHDEQNNGQGGSEKMTIYAYVVATAGKTTENPNGLFSMYFCGEAISNPGTCVFKGALKSDTTGLSFYQEEAKGGRPPSLTRLKLQSNPVNDSGAGALSGTDNGSPYNYKFAFDASHFRRQEDLNAEVCFARDKALGDSSTWRYGVYQSNGDRLDIAHPGFPVKYVNGSDTSYGFWSFWGLWLPESAMSEIALGHGTLTRQVNGVDVVLTPSKKGGKLWKLAKHVGHLDDFKNVSMMYWSQTAIGSGPANTNYELQWDGALLKAIGYQQCSPSGCSAGTLANPVALSASTLAGAHIQALPIFFPSGGGNGSVEVPVNGAFDGSSTLSYRSRDVVDPASADIGLNCVSQCVKTGTALVSGGLLDASPFVNNGVFGPSDTNYSYTYHAGMLTDSNGDADASGASKSSMGANQWGLTTGSMVADADLPSIRCDSTGAADPAGGSYCSSLMDQAVDTTYQWETGPNQWNQFFGASGVTIDPPKSLSLDVVYVDGNPGSANNIAGTSAANFNGNKVQLQFSGFGELQGIPGGCVDPETNLPAQCGQNSRWVPAFDMKDGKAISDGTSSFYVKYLERELRLGKVNCAAVSSSLTLTAANALTLPDNSTVDVNSKTTLGTEPTPGSAKASVIDGIVQAVQ